MIVAVTTVRRGVAWPHRSAMGGEKHERLAEAAQSPAIDRAKRGTLGASPPSNQDGLDDPPVKGSASPMATVPDAPQNRQGVRRIAVAPNDNAARNTLA
jgi:hypothetical protein